MLANIETLKSIGRECEAGRPLRADHRFWLAESINRYLENHCANLNEAFGIVHDRGGVPWWREEGIRVRDRALRELARRFYPEGSAYSRVKAIAAVCNRYHTTCWPRDRQFSEMPVHYRGTAKAYLWKAFRSKAKMPISERHLRNLLSG